MIEDRARGDPPRGRRAAPADVVLLAGKGHEDYQEIAGAKLPFSDARQAAKALAERAGRGAEASPRPAAPMIDARRGGAPCSRCAARRRRRPRRSRACTATRAALRAGRPVRRAARRALRRARLPRRRAAAPGAVAALAERGLDEAGLPGLEVADSRRALGDFAAAWRRALHHAADRGDRQQRQDHRDADDRGDPACLASATPRSRPQGNFNNDIGLPLTLLRLRDEHRAAVVELGMNHPARSRGWRRSRGRRSRWSTTRSASTWSSWRASRPSRARTAAAIAALRRRRHRRVPGRRRVRAALARARRRARACVDFALDAPAAVTADRLAVARRTTTLVTLRTPAGAASFALRVAGRHNVRNALAASACALAAGAPLDAIGAGLEAFAPVRGRSQTKRLRAAAAASVTLVDDTYNANPDSVRAAIDVLAALPGAALARARRHGRGRRPGARRSTREVGAYARERGIERSGQRAPSASTARRCRRARHFDDRRRARRRAGRSCRAARSVLVKGSRFMQMERVVAGPRRPAGASIEARPRRRSEPHAA